MKNNNKPLVFAIMGLGGKLKPKVTHIDRLFGYGAPMRKLAVSLNARLYQHHSEEIVVQEIIRQKTDNDSPIVIIGHSLGGNTAARIARRLDETWIAVNYLVLLDAHGSPRIPESTIMVDNLAPGKWPFGLELNKGTRTVIANSSHSNLPDRPEVMNLLTNKINSIN